MKTKKVLIGVLIAVMLSSLTACGSAKDSKSAENAVSSVANSAGFGGSEDAVVTEEQKAGAVSIQDSVEPTGESKRIYRGELSLETTQFEEAQAALDRLVNEMGGYFQERRVSGLGNTYQNGWYVARIPTERFDEFCSRTGEICHLLSAYTTAEDVSENYYDLESRLKTQQTKLARLQDLLSKATTMEDIITLESAISETEQAVEGLTGSLRGYDSLIDYATVTLSLQEVYQLSTDTEKADGFGERLGNAFAHGLRSAARGLEGLLLGLASHWVVAVILLVLAVAGWRLWKKRRTTLDTWTNDENGPSEPPPQ